MSTYKVTRIHSTEQKEVEIDTFTSRAKAESFCKNECKDLRPNGGTIFMPKNDLFTAKFIGGLTGSNWVVTYHITKVN